MASTFKISFPLPGRRPNTSAQTTPASQGSPSNSSEGDGSPLSYPGSKAERILGATDFDRGDLRKNQVRKERKKLRKYPSFMSVTLADTDNDKDREEEGFPFPGMKTMNEANRQNAQALSRQGSSPLLGEHCTGRSTTTGNLSTPSSPHARRTESGFTLRSHYDKSNLSLLISQQTSSSSARDLALRKGMPQITSPLNHNVLGDLKSVEANMVHFRKFSADSKVSEGSKVSASSKIAGTPRRRPSVTDHPTLYPNAPRAFHAVSPPPALIDSSLPKPMCPADQQTKRPRWWHRSKTEHPSLSPLMVAENLHITQKSEQGISTGKVNVRKPKSGARNWFDGIDEEDVHVKPQEESMQWDRSKYELAERPLAHLTNPEIPAQDPRPTSPKIIVQDPKPAPRTSRKSSFSSKSGPSDRKLSFRLDSAPHRRTYSNLSSQRPTMQSTTTSPGSPSGRSLCSTGSGRGISAGIDLRISSVLDLGSSDDDDNNTMTVPAEIASRGHRIRASVERADVGDDMMLGNAQRVQQVRPRSIVNKHSRRPSSRRSNDTETVPPVPEIPPRPQLGQRNSSLRWREMMEEKNIATFDQGETSSTVESGENSGTNVDTPLSSPVSTRTTSTSHKKKGSFRGSKLMKVTPEEEKLLEAMREKRASIRHNDYQKGFKKAMQLQAGQEIFAPRPQTAGVDGRASFHRTSSLYDPRHSGRGGSRGSISPPPMLTSARYGHENKLSLASLGTDIRMSASTDNLHELDPNAFPFPQVPEIIRPSLRPDGYPGKSSPSLSFSPSDILPSTPSTRNDPLTPPPRQGSIGSIIDGVVFPGIGRSPSRTVGKVVGIGGVERGGHGRKRTVSSGVVMLDGVERAAMQADEERAIVGWALDSY
ncbi:MAG: hypothetical protein Q9164_000407 [Protoblastenia rupestris]